MNQTSRFAPYLYVAPLVALLLFVFGYPLVRIFEFSFKMVRGIDGPWIGLRNYERLLTNSDYMLSLSNTINFTFWSLSIKFVTGMTIAMILHSKLPWRNLLSAIMLLPWIVPEIVTALAWKSIYDPLFGGLNPILQGMGVINRPLGWLSDANLALGSVIAVNVWKGIPFFTLLLLAGLKAIDTELYESAEVDGANAVQRFRYVTWPGLRNVNIFLLIITTVGALKLFTQVDILTKGGPNGATTTIIHYLFKQGYATQKVGYASAVAVFFFLAVTAIALLQRRVLKNEGEA